MDKYKDASLPIKERVEDLLSKMTLEFSGERQNLVLVRLQM